MTKGGWKEEKPEEKIFFFLLGLRQEIPGCNFGFPLTLLLYLQTGKDILSDFHRKFILHSHPFFSPHEDNIREKNNFLLHEAIKKIFLQRVKEMVE